MGSSFPVELAKRAAVIAVGLSILMVPVRYLQQNAPGALGVLLEPVGMIIPLFFLFFFIFILFRLLDRLDRIEEAVRELTKRPRT